MSFLQRGRVWPGCICPGYSGVIMPETTCILRCTCGETPNIFEKSFFFCSGVRIFWNIAQRNGNVLKFNVRVCVPLVHGRESYPNLALFLQFHGILHTCQRFFQNQSKRSYGWGEMFGKQYQAVSSFISLAAFS
jgi:hypothetical protein